MQAHHDTDLDRQGFLLLAFDLLVAAIVVWFVGEMLAWSAPGYTAIVLAAVGILAVMGAFVVDAG
jgi:hypothetical protein